MLFACTCWSKQDLHLATRFLLRQRWFLELTSSKLGFLSRNVEFSLKLGASAKEMIKQEKTTSRMRALNHLKRGFDLFGSKIPSIFTWNSQKRIYSFQLELFARWKLQNTQNTQKHCLFIPMRFFPIPSWKWQIYLLAEQFWLTRVVEKLVASTNSSNETMKKYDYNLDDQKLG